MRIVVNDIAASTGGALTVLKDFYQYIIDSKDKNEWIFLLGGNYIESTQNIKIIVLDQIKKNKLNKLAFDLVIGKKFIEKFKPDLVFSLQNIITFGLKSKQVVYVHQPLPFQEEKKFSFLKANERTYAVYQYLIGYLIKKSVKRAETVIVQTEWMKENVARKSKVSRKRIVKITPNVDFATYASIYSDSNFDPSLFIYPTGTPLYKNNGLLIKAAQILDQKEIKYEVKMTLEPEQILSSIDNLGARDNYMRRTIEEIAPHIKCVGRLPYEEIVKEYFHRTLVFPSYIETFGYPLVEARAAGSIILASDCSFSRELLNGYENAYFFAPDDHKMLATLMEQVINGKIKAQQSHREEKEVKNTWADVMKVLLTV